MRRAREAGLDLVEVASNERPPVCRIMDYGKFKYQKRKREAGQRKNSHHGRQKEIRLRPKTGDHDIEFKVNHAREFLEHRDKVVISVIFRGRENAHADEEGRKVLQKFVSALEDIAKIESGPSKQGRRMICTLTPK